LKKKKRGFKGKWAISAEVHYSSSIAGHWPATAFLLLYFSSSFSLIFKFRGAFSLNERQIRVFFSALSLYLLRAGATSRTDEGVHLHTLKC
jgi:hypothetical protein